MAYDRDSFLAGLAVGRMLWRPQDVPPGDIGFRLEGYPRNNLPITFEPIGYYERNDFEMESGQAYAIVGYPDTRNQRYDILFWGYRPFVIKDTVTYRQGGTNVTYLTAGKSRDTIYYVLATTSQSGYEHQTFDGITVDRATWYYINNQVFPVE